MFIPVESAYETMEMVCAIYKSGKTKAIQALFGMCMRQLKGAGDPAVIKQALENKLNN